MDMNKTIISCIAWTHVTATGDSEMDYDSRWNHVTKETECDSHRNPPADFRILQIEFDNSSKPPI